MIMIFAMLKAELDISTVTPLILGANGETSNSR